MEFSRQEYWSGLPFPSPGDHFLPNWGIKPTSPALAGGFFTTEPPGKTPYLVRTHPNDLVLSWKPLSSNQITFWGTGGGGKNPRYTFWGNTTQPVRVDMGPLAEKEICRSRGERMRLVSCYAAAHATFCLNVLWSYKLLALVTFPLCLYSTFVSAFIFLYWFSLWQCLEEWSCGETMGCPAYSGAVRCYGLEGILFGWH